MKTVGELIAKKMSVINLNMIQTIQSTLTRQTLQDTTQENHQSPNNISQSPLTQSPILATTTTNEDTNIKDQTSSEDTKMMIRGGSNSIAKYCNTFGILQYLLLYFEIFQ